MKKYTFLLIIPALIMQLSCNKNLDPKEYSTLTNENAFNTESDAIAAVNSIYARLKGPSVGDNYDYWTVRHFALTDLTTDDGHCSYGGDPGQLSLVQWNSANGLIAEDYGQIYKLIANANSAIFNIYAYDKYYSCREGAIFGRGEIFACGGLHGFDRYMGPRNFNNRKGSG